MAHKLFQRSDVQERFAARIAAKVQGERDAASDEVRDLPLLGGFFASLTGMMFDAEQSRKEIRGDRAEEEVLVWILRDMPSDWVVFHNAIIEPEPDTFAQIDNLVVSPQGLFLIETKAWRGSYTAYRDTWKRRERRKWIACASPTKQAMRHAILMRKWLLQFRDLDLPEQFPRTVKPLVVFTQAQWLGINACAVEVFDGVRALVRHLRSLSEVVLTPEHINGICRLITEAPMRPPAPVVMPQPVPSRAIPSPTPQQTAPTPISAPLCARCNVPMVLRTTKTGPYQGQQFYGCPNFPRCRKIRKLS